MQKITIYTRAFCPFCSRAVSLLQKKGVDFTEIDAGMDPDRKQEMVSRANGARTFPQIFVGEQHIGGCDEMMALERAGKLDPMIQAAT